MGFDGSEGTENGTRSESRGRRSAHVGAGGPREEDDAHGGEMPTVGATEAVDGEALSSRPVRRGDMEHVAIEDVEPASMTGADRRGLTEPLDTADLAVNHYRLGPGERLSGGLHAHADQEEVFVVVEGEVTFDRPDGSVTVSEDEAVRFAPGEFQTGYNDTDDQTRVLALGAPRDSEDVRVPRGCPECGQENVRVVPSEDGEGFDGVCPECGTEVTLD